MDTTEARIQMRDCGRRGYEALQRFLSGNSSREETAERLRRVTGESRAVLADAGYPGEGVWTSLRRSTAGLDALIEASDAAYWDDLLYDLATATDVLDSLVASPAGRNVDFRIVG